jgi:hypothetical protein
MAAAFNCNLARGWLVCIAHTAHSSAGQAVTAASRMEAMLMIASQNDKRQNKRVASYSSEAEAAYQHDSWDPAPTSKVEGHSADTT